MPSFKFLVYTVHEQKNNITEICRECTIIEVMGKIEKGMEFPFLGVLMFRANETLGAN